MVEYTQHIGLNMVTSSDASEILIDRSNVEPLKWFSIIVNKECYVGINAVADTSGIHLLANESYETPLKSRTIKVTVLRATGDNVTVRGSGWW